MNFPALDLRTFRSTSILVAGICLTLLLATAPQIAVAQKPLPLKSAATARSADRTQELEVSNVIKNHDIKIHGHWTIKIKNLDGSTASISSFDNSLVNGAGDRLLAQVLGHNAEIGGWVVNLAISGANVVSLPERVDIFTAGPLTLTVANGNIVLTGVGRATAAGNLVRVDTQNNYCATNDNAQSCYLRAVTVSSAFTSHTLATPIPIQSGQSIEVTVTFSFS